MSKDAESNSSRTVNDSGGLDPTTLFTEASVQPAGRSSSLQDMGNNMAQRVDVVVEE